MQEHRGQCPYPCIGAVMKSFDQRLEGKWHEDNGCHIWTGAKNKKGYARINGGYVHRLAYIHKYGPLPPWLWCLHTCHNPSCINPDHLYLGDHTQNMADLRKKGSKKGENHHTNKLTETAVLEIRRLRGHGASCREIGAWVGIAPQHISAICRREYWSHI